MGRYIGPQSKIWKSITPKSKPSQETPAAGGAESADKVELFGGEDGTSLFEGGPAEEIEIRSQGQFNNGRDQSIAFRTWLPAEGAKAKICLFHGTHEHCGRYANLAHVLVKEGFEVYAMDHHGHGKSDDSAGHRVDCQSFDHYIDDAEQFLREVVVVGGNPGLPLFIFAHSMGSMVATLLILRLQRQKIAAGKQASNSAVVEESDTATGTRRAWM